jgi:O-antigen chain-terminating methyltransferase
VIETTVPEIDVAELMERVRAEAVRPKPPRQILPPAESAPLPPVAMLPTAPAVWIPGTVKSRKDRLDVLVQSAREKNEPSSKVPKFLRRFFRKQGGYNRAVVESISALSKATDDLTRRVGEITACLGQFNSWLLALHEQSDADAAWMKAAASGVSRIAKLEKNLELVENHWQATDDKLHELSIEQGKAVQRVTAIESGAKESAKALETIVAERFVAVGDAVELLQQEIKGSAATAANAIEQARSDSARAEQETRSLRADFEHAAIHLRNLQAQTDGISRQLAELSAATSHPEERKEDLQRQADLAGLHLRNLQAQTDRLGVHINNLQGFVDKKTAETDAIHHGMEQRLGDQANLAQRFVAFEERTITDAALIKGELSEYGALFRRLLDRQLDAPAEAGKGNLSRSAVATKPAPGLDAFYLAFENRFRGPRDVIKKRVEFYLPFLRKCRAGASGRPVLDVGCGRGEWLELLKEHELDGRGVDLNTAMVAQCKARGLKVELQDAIEHLRSLRPGTQGAVTGFHIIEHLPFETLMELCRQARRVLKPGGVAIFESPNCKNLVVGACNFHIDPTHRHPVFPETAELMLSSQGFENIQIEYLSPVPNVKFEGATPELASIRDLLYGPQDFGIIAYKPKKQ